jgi:hypothetical protein
VFVEIVSSVGDGLSVPIIKLNENGKIIDEYIKNIAIKYVNVIETQNGTGNPSPTKNQQD